MHYIKLFGEKTYVTGEVPASSNGTNTFGIGAGAKNTYIIDKEGDIYANGEGINGSLGNGVPESSSEYSLVGDRTIKIEPETKIMQVGDVETLDIKGNPFNVFKEKEVSLDEYEFELTEEGGTNIVSIANAELTAVSEGTAHINVKDKLTANVVNLTRVVIPRDKDRILQIAVNGINAELSKDSTEDNLIYHVKIDTKDTEGSLLVKTKETTDRISISAGADWSYNGILNDTISIGESLNIVRIKVGVQNNQGEFTGEEFDYTLIIENTYVRNRDNVNLLKVEVDGKEAKLKEDGRYYYTLDSAKTSVNVYAETEAEISFVSIQNNSYSLHHNRNEITICERETEVKIKVRAQDGTLKEYLLLIQGLPDNVNIKTVSVNGKEAVFNEIKERYEIRTNETEFNVEITLEDILASMILGTNEKAIGYDSISISKKGEETIVKVSVTSQSELVTEEYEIAIIEKSKNASLDTVIVNGKKVIKNADGEYYIGVAHKTENINVEAKAEDEYAITMINDTENASYIAVYNEPKIEGKDLYEYRIKVIAESGNEEEYILKVKILDANYDISSIFVR